jgi:hypothetical protein
VADLVAQSQSTKLGDRPPAEAAALQAQKRQLRRDLKTRKQWANYSRPIHINYGQSSPTDDPVQYTWRTSLKALRKLEREYNAGDPFIRQSLTPFDYTRLQFWIKHRWQDDLRLQEQASQITHLELHFSEGDTLTLSPTSDKSQIKSLLHLHDRSEIYLHDAELLALTQWLAEPSTHTLQPDKQPQSEKSPPQNPLNENKSPEKPFPEKSPRLQSIRRRRARDKDK